MRHGESSGNVDESVYSHVPDWRVRLSATGHAQAIQTGRQLQQLIGSEPTIFYVSPYYRTRETFANVILQLNPTQVLDVRMEPRLREQDFGNFQCSDRMALAKSERGLFGRFFYRFPNGESGADVYDRVSTFLETLARDIQSESLGGDTNAVIVSHGLTMRLFLMRWYHWPVELFEGTDNPRNAQMIVMVRRSDGNGYEIDSDSLALIGLEKPEGADNQQPILLPRQREYLRHSLGKCAGFCEFTSANAALRARAKTEQSSSSVRTSSRGNRGVTAGSVTTESVTAEDVACAERRAETLNAEFATLAPCAPEFLDEAAPVFIAAHDDGGEDDGVLDEKEGEGEMDSVEEEAAVERHCFILMNKARRPTLPNLHSGQATGGPAVGMIVRPRGKAPAGGSRARGGGEQGF